MNDQPPRLDKGPGEEPERPPSSYQPYQDPSRPNPYGAYGPYGAPYAPVDHPQSTTVLVLGILGLVLCGILGIVAWVMGNRVVREIDASNGGYGGRSNANIGRILGMVSTGLMVLGVVVFLGVVSIALVGVSSGT